MIRFTRQGLTRAPGLLAVAVALALVLRLLIPTGFMPASGGGGLVICTGHGPPAAPGTLPTAPAKGKAASACAFAAMAIPLQPSPPVFSTSGGVEARPVAIPVRGDQLAEVPPAAPRPPAIGPPLSV